MLRSAADLFGRHGYHATSWRQVVDHGDAPWGSINFLFPKGKDQLAVEAASLAGRDFESRLRQAFFDPTDVTRSLVSLVDGVIAELEGSDFEVASPIAILGLEMSHRSATIQAACAEVYRGWQLALTELLSPQLGAANAEDLAGLFLSAFDGAAQRARIVRDPAPLTELASRLPQLVKTVTD
jgi:TetR/AcrR family transcriptional regulator, lmrAB and yxaGH operons repressor